MTMKFKGLCLLTGALAVSGCATITRGTTSDVQFLSTPTGAAVTTSIGPACTTPCTLKFDRRDTFTATFKLGEQEKQVFVDTEIAGEGVAVSGVGNALLGGVIGVGVDVATGAGLNHTPNPVSVTFDTVPTEAEASVESATEAESATEVESATDAETTTDGEFKWES
ncbi:MAG: translation initiation factor 2 [Pseudomonadota bacterium]